MFAMVLREAGGFLAPECRPTPEPGPGEVRIRVEACAVCRTDLHLIDGELPQATYPIVPGHEVVGIVAARGPDVREPPLGSRVGVPWLGHACGHCSHCEAGRENLCDAPGFTGCTRDGGFATDILAEAAFTIPLGADLDPVATAPLLCAGLIGWRTLRMAGAAETVGLYGFGAAAHIIAQVCRWQGRRVFAFTRPGDRETQAFARSVGAEWAGGTDAPPPAPLDAALVFAPDGAFVPTALKAVRKGGRVVCGGIHMSDIPAFPYELLWGERAVLSVANLAREDARSFFALVPRAGIVTHTRPYPLERANEAIADHRSGILRGAAVLVPQPLARRPTT
ncbi:zinc-binding alcohol dehydrogenase family protein [Methylobacterium sp. Leaf88]|uniref:zinc-binding alcohol dehydrogenase family protein n=1 Tax=Methylobacterium sp. Leaf88 TaxID=1736244 RepID=UPI0007007D7B|nr:zinc-binding alcohol dehydrogenase family protein [Methylobacterium sp. Leaf88]KQO78285.1 alcohol dehydrogenase [Methylobacterium sp. Leaf88]